MNWIKYLSAKRLRPTTRQVDNDPRNEFESDFGRVIFSPAIRRMHDKTQVFPLTTDDNIHSRLTHSMEVMAIGHSLGLRLCENNKFQEFISRDKNEILREIPVLLKNACLVHDIGNPPFGHFGETVIQNYFEDIFKNKDYSFNIEENAKIDFTKFDGNAQGFRVLTKLQVLDDAFGLNLTYASLGAYVKYPNTKEINKDIISKKKRGVFQTEEAYLNEIFTECGLNNDDGTYRRHPLSFLMEAADSICYSVMDIEDGYNKGWYNYDFIKSKLEHIEGMTKIFSKVEAKDEITDMPPSEIKKVVNLRIQLISRLVIVTIENFINNYKEICNGTYNKELINDDESNLAETLQIFCSENIFPKHEVQSLELTGHSVLSGLLDYYVKFIFKGNKDYKKRAVGLISNSIIKAALIENNFDYNIIQDTSNYYKLFELPVAGGGKRLDDYSKLRIIVDFVAGMTDQYALNHYQKLSGQKIS
jgi:dGTPase